MNLVSTESFRAFIEATVTYVGMYNATLRFKGKSTVVQISTAYYETPSI